MPASRISGGGRGAGGLVHGGVGEHDAAQLVAVGERPAEGDQPAPVVRDGDDRAGEPERGGERRRGRRPARRSGRGSVRAAPRSPCRAGRRRPPASPGGAGGQEPAPQVGPGGVAVHAQQGADRSRPRRCRARASGAARPSRVGDVDRAATRPGPAGQAGEGRAAGSPVVTRRSRQRGVQARADAQQQHPVAGLQRVGLLRQGERQRGRADVAAAREGSGHLVRSMPSASQIARVCTKRDLVDDVAVDVRAQSNSAARPVQAPWPARGPPRAGPWGRSACRRCRRRTARGARCRPG